MLRLLVTLAPAIVAAGIGVFAQTAETPEGYVSALRVMITATLVLTWIAVVIHVWRNQESLFKRLFLALLMLATLRVLYVPLLDFGLLGAAWTGRLGAKFGMEDRGYLVHAAFGFWIAVLAGPLCMGVVAAVTRPFIWAGKLVIALLVLLALAAFLAPGDRNALPHDLTRFEAAERNAPLDEPTLEEESVSYGDVLVRRGERFSTRVVVFSGMLVEFALPRAGWGGIVRTALQERCAESAPDSWRAYVADIEYAFVEARPFLHDQP